MNNNNNQQNDKGQPQAQQAQNNHGDAGKSQPVDQAEAESKDQPKQDEAPVKEEVEGSAAS